MYRTAASYPSGSPLYIASERSPEDHIQQDQFNIPAEWMMWRQKKKSGEDDHNHDIYIDGYIKHELRLNWITLCRGLHAQSIIKDI